MSCLPALRVRGACATDKAPRGNTSICPEFSDPLQKLSSYSLHGENTLNFEFPLYTKNGQPMVVRDTIPGKWGQRVLNLHEDSIGTLNVWSL